MVFVSPNSGVELETIRAQVRSRGAKAGVLRECLGSVRRILEGASGNLAAEALLRRNANPTEGEIRQAISGNLCRCTGYVNIVKSVQYAAGKLQGTDTSEPTGVTAGTKGA